MLKQSFITCIIILCLALQSIITNFIPSQDIYSADSNNNQQLLLCEKEPELSDDIIIITSFLG